MAISNDCNILKNLLIQILRNFNYLLDGNFVRNYE